MTVDYSRINVLSDESVIEDPYPYYEFLRTQGRYGVSPATACS